MMSYPIIPLAAKRWLLALSICGVAALTACGGGKTDTSTGGGTTPTPTPTPPAPLLGAVQANLFGLHIHNAAGPVWPAPVNPAQATAWPTPAFGSWRLWDADVTWPQIQPQRGQWDFSRLDAYVSLAESHGVEIIMPLGLTPAWASARPTESSSYGAGNAAEPANMEDWRNFVRTVATRYWGRIKHYEIWNEVNETGFYSGSVETMVTLVREARQVLLSVDPEIHVISPSVVGGSDARDWLDRFFAAGGGAQVDIIGYHFYVHSTNPEAMIPLITEMRALMTRHGQQAKELWNTETGWLIANGDGTPNVSNDPNWPVLDAETAAGYVIRSYALAHANGIKRFYWYSWDGGNIGLIEPAAKTLKPAGQAYARAIEWLVGSQFDQCNQAGNVWSCPLRRADGRNAYLVWTQNGVGATWLAPTSFGAREYLTRDGVSHALATVTTPVPIGGTPVMVLAN